MIKISVINLKNKNIFKGFGEKFILKNRNFALNILKILKIILIYIRIVLNFLLK